MDYSREWGIINEKHFVAMKDGETRKFVDHTGDEIVADMRGGVIHVTNLEIERCSIQGRDDKVNAASQESVRRILAELGWTVTYSDDENISAVRGSR
jgi:hypothetical protein